MNNWQELWNQKKRYKKRYNGATGCSEFRWKEVPDKGTDTSNQWQVKLRILAQRKGIDCHWNIKLEG
jgi:hypothetical protein